ncbi:hypothetical protein [Streptomyces bottropensis]|uniref:hypothetical protein n=1 Tax=Streptomyces bottropensis TaxID=42235 RepID=UPI0036A52C28
MPKASEILGRFTVGALTPVDFDVSHGLFVELTIHAEESKSLQEAAFGWLTGGIRKYDRQGLIGHLKENLKVSGNGFSRIIEAIPRKHRKGFWGSIQIAPSGTFEVLYNPYVEDALLWLRDHLFEHPESAGVKIGRFTEDGEVGNSDISFNVTFEEELTDYVKLGLHVDTASLVDAGSTAAEHERLLATVRWACERYNVVFSHVSYRHSGGATELESRLRGRSSDPVSNIPQWRTLLRGYSWIMVVSAEIAELLGGNEALRDTGAFSGVSALPNGALLLQATPTFQQYDGEAVRAVYEVFRDVLVQGEPRSPLPMPGQPPVNLVVTDG